LNPLQK